MKTEQEHAAEYRRLDSEQRVLGAIETGPRGQNFNFGKYLREFYRGFGPDQLGRWPVFSGGQPTIINDLNERAFHDWQYTEKHRPEFVKTMTGWAAEWLVLKSLSERYNGGLKFSKNTDPTIESKGEDLAVELPFGERKQRFRFDITTSDVEQLHQKQERAEGEARFRSKPLETIIPLPIGKLMGKREQFVQLQNYDNIRIALAENLMERYIPELLHTYLAEPLAKEKLDLKECRETLHILPRPGKR